MKLHLSLLLISVFIFIAGRAQSPENIKRVQQKILSADSIVLISHILTAEFAPKIVVDSDIKETNNKKYKIKKILSPTYLKKGKINPAIIKQRKTISKAEATRLSQLLKYEIVKEVNQIKCDIPHHSILIYKKNTFSYIDLCLDCKHVNTSKDIDLTDGDFTDKKWENLKLFFKQHGLTYELN